MVAHTTSHWTDERVNTTVSRRFVNTNLTQEEREILGTTISFGDGLTDSTYLDWILERAKKLFLILVDVGVPDQIFGLVDEAYDDGDLPIALEAVQDLALAPEPDLALDRKFHKAQFKYLIKSVHEGEHVKYTADEAIPIELLGVKAGIATTRKDGLDKVRLATKPLETFSRKRVVFKQGLNSVTEADVLSEVVALRELVHEHLVSVYGSYLCDDSVYVLLSPSAEYTLKSFISDTPKYFESLPKLQRRETLINWPHCLANGLDWLHGKGLHHGAIRPSNVFVDSNYRIYLGQFNGFKHTQAKVKADDIEVYQYAAPEKWKRAVKAQTTDTGGIALPSGGRTSKNQSMGNQSPVTSNGKRLSSEIQSSGAATRSSIDTVKPTSGASSLMSNLRGKHGLLPDTSGGRYRSSASSSNSSSGKSKSSIDRTSTSEPNPRKPPSSLPISFVTTDTSGDSSTARQVVRDPVILAPRETRTTILQIWHSAQFDPLPADVFALGCLAIDILTLLSKRSASAFSRFRSAKNRNAGRGGGLADASFHANLGQVGAWMALVVADAEMKAGKDGGQTFRAVGPMMEVVRGCVVREPEERITASELEHKIGDCIWRTANLTKLHCYKTYRTPDQEKDGVGETDRARSGDTERPLSRDVNDKGKMAVRQNCNGSGQLVGDAALGLESSTSSLSSFNFDYDFDGAVPDRHPNHKYPGAATADTSDSTWDKRQSGALAPSRSNESNTLASSIYDDGDEGYYVVKEQGDTAGEYTAEGRGTSAEYVEGEGRAVDGGGGAAGEAGGFG